MVAQKIIRFGRKYEIHKQIAGLTEKEWVYQKSRVSGQINDFYSDSQLDSCGFSGQRKVWIGPAGTCFFEDTRGLHRAYPPHKMPRLMFSMVWTIGPGFNSGLT